MVSSWLEPSMPDAIDCALFQRRAENDLYAAGDVEGGAVIRADHFDVGE
jgi:hypothetical protein